MLPIMAMIVVQVLYALISFTRKLAMDCGMNPLIFVAYRQIFATLAPDYTAYSVPGILVFYDRGSGSTATIACALDNVLSAITFVLAVSSDKKLQKQRRVAKVVGTIVGVGGAMLLSFYHGHTIDLGTTEREVPRSIHQHCIDVFHGQHMSAWSLQNPVWLIVSLFAGILGSTLAFFLTSCSIQMKGPVYASALSPLMLIAVVILSWALLHETLYVGTVYMHCCGSPCYSLGEEQGDKTKTKIRREQQQKSIDQE
ncbi:hypothetical protein FNV43_RR02113 [Rhamnella rubrinervis]|uniref:WAT1-related protein n=1 Tax=Rhamnella rubrinervis TaxID=2594499 RepID=A0A8K0HT87_9ROSA|nr:hypothetical protein FNV43_RR02113 [Rhamnella rubrinervis]